MTDAAVHRMVTAAKLTGILSCHGDKMHAVRLTEQFERRLREQIRENSNVLQYPRRFAERVERDGAFLAAEFVFNKDMAERTPRHAPFEDDTNEPSAAQWFAAQYRTSLLSTLKS